MTYGLLKSFRHVKAIFLVFALLVVLSGAYFIKQNKAEAKTPARTVATESIPSQFSFSGASGWHKGPTNETSMALFKDDRECFTSIEHKPGIVDVDADIQKQQSMVAGGGNTMAAGATPAVTVQTDTGSQQYQLHEFTLSSGDAGHPLMGGLGLGYVQLSGGYLYIQSHCNRSDELPATIPALQAYHFTLKP
jgi:hypothetical protein